MFVTNNVTYCYTFFIHVFHIILHVYHYAREYDVICMVVIVLILLDPVIYIHILLFVRTEFGNVCILVHVVKQSNGKFVDPSPLMHLQLVSQCH